MSFSILLFTISFLVLSSSLSYVSSGPLLRAPRDATKTGKYIVLLHSNVSREEFEVVLQRALSLSQDSRPYVVVTDIEKLFVLDLNLYSVHEISNWPQVKFIEEETEAVATQDPSVPWHLDQLDQLSSTGRPIDHQFRPLATGEPVDVYIMDTGINYDHEEFDGRAKYPGYDPFDAYQRIPLYHRYGRDCNGHGTHVASLFGGRHYGVAKSVTLFSVRVLNCRSRAPWSVVIDGLDYVMKLSSKRKRATVVNLSLGGAYQRTVNEAVDRLVEEGVVVVVAAGNDKKDACGRSPASANNVITVGGTQKNGQIYTFTNIGHCVDIFGPGSLVRGAHHECSQHSIEHPNERKNNSCSTYLSGTSMATPIVGGVAALLLDRQPLLSPNEVKERLIDRSVSGFVKGISLPTRNRFVNTQGSCGGYYPFRTSFTLSSPGYPDSYPEGVICEWLLPVRYNEDVGVVITDLDLENNYDYLYLCQGDNNCTSYTGRHRRYVHYRTSNKNLTIRLVTDKITSGRGFQLNFTKYYTKTPFQVTDKGELLPIDTTSLPLATTETHVKVGVVEIHSLIKRMKSKNFEILSVSVSLASNDKWYYAVVFHNSTRTPSGGFVELTSAGLNRTLLTLHEKGLTEYSIIARVNGTTPLYSVVYRKVPVYIESYVYWGVSLPTHVISKVSLKRQGWYLTSQHFLTYSNGRTTVSAIYHRDLRRIYDVPLEYERNLTSDSYYGFQFSKFTSLTLEFLHQNYHPTSISTYHHHHGNGADTRFSVIYEEKVKGESSEFYWIRWGLNSSKVFSEITYFDHHWDVVSLTSYKYQNELQYVMIWGRNIGY